MPILNNSQRPVKPEEIHHRPLEENLIGTLTIITVGAHGNWTPGVQENQNLSLGALLTNHHLNGHTLLWAYRAESNQYEIKFGYDKMVLPVNAAIPGAPPQIKIGHVALTDKATISGEIISVGAHWELDNYSGAWGSMGGQNGKSRVMDDVALLIATHDPGGIVVHARRAYSHVGWKLAIQRVFR
jgi:hypothetical protein